MHEDSGTAELADHGRSCSLHQTSSDELADHGPSGPVSDDVSVETLADPRLISIEDLVTELGSDITDVLESTRNSVTDRLQTEYGDTPITGASNFDGIARNAINVALSDSNIRRQARPVMEEAIQRTLDRLGSDNHSPKIERGFGFRDREDARFYARNVEFSTRNAADDMLDRFRNGVRHGAQRSETIDTIVERIENEYDRSTLRQRARLIARMELQTAVQSTKLGEYERSDAVDGVRVINPCTDATTRLCEHLAGCGVREPAVAWFDDGGLSGQFQEHIDNEMLFDGFAPLPAIPPFHWNCRSGLAPITRKDE